MALQFCGRSSAPPDRGRQRATMCRTRQLRFMLGERFSAPYTLSACDKAVSLPCLRRAFSCRFHCSGLERRSECAGKCEAGPHQSVHRDHGCERPVHDGADGAGRLHLRVTRTEDRATGPLLPHPFRRQTGDCRDGGQERRPDDGRAGAHSEKCHRSGHGAPPEDRRAGGCNCDRNAADRRAIGACASSYAYRVHVAQPGRRSGPNGSASSRRRASADCHALSRGNAHARACNSGSSTNSRPRAGAGGEARCRRAVASRGAHANDSASQRRTNAQRGAVASGSSGPCRRARLLKRTEPSRTSWRNANIRSGPAAGWRRDEDHQRQTACVDTGRAGKHPRAVGARPAVTRRSSR